MILINILTLSLLRRWVCPLKQPMFKFDLSIFELRYNEVHCHSLKLYPFLSSKMIMVSLNGVDYCRRKVTHLPDRNSEDNKYLRH